ncbi:receptor protein [Trifolium repens]|nr:receptor protein [Trifolium repens]
MVVKFTRKHFHLLYISSLLKYKNHLPKCHDDEGFHINNSASLNPLSYPKTASWNSSTGCCSWDGIQCDDHRNQVIHIDLSSSQLYGRMDANSS